MGIKASRGIARARGIKIPGWELVPLAYPAKVRSRKRWKWASMQP